jgi:Transglutaminase-like superfamily
MFLFKRTQSVSSSQTSPARSRPGLVLIFRAFCSLVAHDLFLRRNSSFQALYERIRSFPVARREPPSDAIERATAAVEKACVFYPKAALCLQRSAVTVALLRKLGVQAQMAFGVQQLPFKAHAWVEVAGTVVNDHPDVEARYCVMERI